MAAAYLHFEQGDYTVARSQFEDVVKSGQSMSDPALAAEALGGLSILALRQGDLTRALDMAQQAVTLATAAGDEFVIADQLNHRGAAKSACGDPSDRADFERALAGFRKIDDRFGIARVLQSLAIREIKMGNLVAAKTYINESLDLKREVPSEGMAFRCVAFASGFG